MQRKTNSVPRLELRLREVGACPGRDDVNRAQCSLASVPDIIRLEAACHFPHLWTR
ncbi:hypothetical protein BOTBODRAFT_33142 [Botryobasidium botryosum FD-172 SS1]|uniref:Uncharacterized protein n=1 Tax=Botryobasidium botryosum (strain FD-172 SS1) TaxID=930990 RepID=A0A067MR12_BOTB1|nr:hypothetical protein BOTBODRAFT_33142 [Botryobasidium botryosum FD-172 SS1]